MAEPGLVDNTGPGCGVRGAGARERPGLWKTGGPGVCWVLPRKTSKQQH